MRPSIPVLLLTCLFGAVPRAQGVVNPSLLEAPDDLAPPTWSSWAFERVQRSVVHVAVEVDGERGAFVLERPSSGVIVEASGWVVTFHHLVREAVGAGDKRIKVRLNDAENTVLLATFVRHDELSGLALLRVTPPAGGLAAVPLGEARPSPGLPVLVVARPAGEDMLAFAGVLSAALADVSLFGRSFAAGNVFLTDSRNDERCDGASVFAADGSLLGLYASEHVQRDKSEPTLEDLKQPSFGVVVPVANVQRAFRDELGRAAELAEGDVVGPWEMAVATVAPSVVSVFAGSGDWPTADGGDPGATQRTKGLGSGVVLSARGLVVTNLHVLDGKRAARVRTGDGRTFDAELVKDNAPSNLALLKVKLPAGQALKPAASAPDDDLELGEAVLAVGNPYATGVVVTAGVVSAKREREGGRVQADANLGNANGGGAIVDAAGRLVGIGDAGAIDPLDMAYAMRGDRVTQETNLSTFVGIARVRRVFEEPLAASADGAESILTPPPATAEERGTRRTPLTDMVRRAAPAMLNIYVARNVAEVDPDDPFPPDPVWRPLSLGSGVIIDRSGLAISNWHVVDDATNPDGSMVDDHRVTARVFGGREYEVRVLSISREDDLSLLQLVLEPGEEVAAVELGNSDALRIGEAVAAIGNPHGRANTITCGVVSAKGQGIRVRGRWAKLDHLIETDAAINGGNSGGALLDMNGRLVGINSAGGGTFNNKGYAIAVDHVRRQVLGLLFQPYKLRSPELGMRVLDDQGKVVVMDVDPRGPAAAAGVRSGDRVVSLGGTEITWSPGFATTLLRQEPGVPVALAVERRGEPLAFEVAPLPASTWSVVRQSGLACRDFAYADDPERVRLASIALHKAFTGDVAGAPTDIPSQVVAIERVFRQDQPEADVRPGDLLLAVELRRADSGDPVLMRVDGVAALRDWFNDRELGSYEGTRWRCWLARGNEVLAVEVVAKRLLW